MHDKWETLIRDLATEHEWKTEINRDGEILRMATMSAKIRQYELRDSRFEIRNLRFEMRMRNVIEIGHFARLGSLCACELWLSLSLYLSLSLSLSLFLFLSLLLAVCYLFSW